MSAARASAARLYRRGPGSLYRRAKSIQYLATRDRTAVLSFLAGAGMRSARAGAGAGGDRPDAARAARLSLRARADLIRRFVTITNHVRGYHTLTEMLVVTRAILARPAPCVLEAGTGHGSSTAKLSLATRAAGGALWVFDSFRGLPDNAERHTHLDGRPVTFRAGAFRATLPAVQRTVTRFGAPEVCRFHKGWFADTLPGLPGERCIDVAVLDVDLAASTRRCIREIYPRLRPGGVLISLDGQLRATHEILSDAGFWRDEVGAAHPPPIAGLGREKLLFIDAPA